MEFSFNIHHLLKDEITIVDHQLLPCKQNSMDRFGFQQLKNMLYEIVDTMGEASAKAQGLRGSITTGTKLSIGNQRLYLMKDKNSNNVLGILKVGTKKLFVYDNAKRQHEMDPMCVLDFYVHESRQRMGCGKKLFSYMLQREGIPVQHLAIDRPSMKFSSFLQKHYNLRGTIPQVNNYTIFEGFFTNRSDKGDKDRRRNIEEKPPLMSNLNRPSSGNKKCDLNLTSRGKRRYVLSSPQNSHRSGYANETGQKWTYENNQPKLPLPEEELNSIKLATNLRPSQHGMGAGDMMYSRHGNSGQCTPGLPGSHTSSANSQHRTQLADLPQSADLTKLVNNQTFGNANHASGVNSRPYHSHPETVQQKHHENSSPQRGGLYGNQSGNDRNRIVQSQGTRAPTPPKRTRSRGTSLSRSGSRGRNGLVDNANLVTPPSPAPVLPDISQPQPGGNNVVKSRPPSGSRGINNKTLSQPPLLQREGRPGNYTGMLNMHQTFQGRGGHLKVNNSPTAGFALNHGAPSVPAKDSSWTVGGYLRSQHLREGARHYNPTRLW